jgi:hypothetical protein
MGINIMSCCHKCRVKVFHYRRKENKTIIPFYYKHRNCLQEDPNNIETLDDQLQEKDWMDEYPDGYEDDNLEGY